MKPLLPIEEMQLQLKNYLLESDKIWLLIPSGATQITIQTPEIIQSGMSNKVFFLDISVRFRIHRGGSCVIGQEYHGS